MINKIIYFPIEVKKRELDSRCYQALKLINKGFVVSVCSKSAIAQYRKSMKRGIIYFKSSGPRYYDLMKKLKEIGHKNIMMDEEGLILLDENLYSQRFFKKNFQYLDMIFTWGKKDFHAIRKLTKHSKIFDTGSSRIDLLTQKTNKIYFDQAKKIRKKYGKFILINTLFTKVNHFFHKSSDDYLKKVADAKNVYKFNERQLDLSHKQVKVEKAIFKDFKKFLEIFSKNFSRYKLIIRPHPSENHNTWKEITKKNKNVVYINDHQSACSWMLASQFSISANCTTAIESFFLKKFNINYRPIKSPEVEYQLPKICGFNIRNIEDLTKFIKKNYHKSNIKINYFSKKNQKILNDKISNSNGSCSVAKMERLLSSNFEFKKENFLMKDKIINLSKFEKFKNFLRIIYLNLKLKIFKSKKSLFSIQKFPGISEKEIFDRISLFKKCLGINTKFSVVEEEPGMFIIKKTH